MSAGSNFLDPHACRDNVMKFSSASLARRHLSELLRGLCLGASDQSRKGVSSSGFGIGHVLGGKTRFKSRSSAWESASQRTRPEPRAPGPGPRTRAPSPGPGPTRPGARGPNPRPRGPGPDPGPRARATVPGPGAPGRRLQSSAQKALRRQAPCCFLSPPGALLKF